MRPQQLGFLQKPFKAATSASSSGKPNTIMNPTGAKSTITTAITSILLVPQASFYNLGSINNFVQSELKQQKLGGNLFCILNTNQFHLSATTAKKNNNNEDNSGGESENVDEMNNTNVNGSISNEAPPSSIGEIENVQTAVRGGKSTHSKCLECGRPLRIVRTVNPNDQLLTCIPCGITYSRGSPTSDPICQNAKESIMDKQKFPTPKEITAFLDKSVIGQDDAKRILSLGVYEHYIRLHTNAEYQERITDLAPVQQVAYSSTSRQRTSRSSFDNDMIIDPSVFSNDVMLKHHQYKERLQKKKPIMQPNLQRMNEHKLIRMMKSNIMLVGPSGVGKTYVIKVLADALDVPMAHCDCTTMTQAGYVGEDVESVLQKLLTEVDGDVEKAQKGIVFLDEIDKIAATRDITSYAYRDVSGQGVQQAMLKMVEGSVVSVKKDRKGGGSSQETVLMDTTDILFIASGAFTGLDKLISRRLDKQMLGFGQKAPVNAITKDDKDPQVLNQKRDNLLKQVQAEDMIEFGMIQELVGRFPIRVVFHSLNKDDFKRLITEAENNLLAQARQFFRAHDSELEITEDALDELAERAMQGKTGARALNSILHEVIWEAKYNLPGSNIGIVRITREFIRGEAPYEVIMKEPRQQVIAQRPTAAAAI